MAAKPLPPSDELRKLLVCDFQTGRLFWKARAIDAFPVASRGRTWNTRFAGKPALEIKAVRGYLCGGLNGQGFYARRVIWKMAYGTEPEEIDHINGNRRDNRLVNLRAADRLTNGKNLARKSNNTSGVNGVYWCKRDRIWCSYGKIDRKMYMIGRFETLEEASQSRAQWDRANGFHENHGR